ncbi:MAG: DUF3619 domain-containing protein [Betaproteobacteria bacterium HGW-Betaproteobacteria-8]|nr:MAG: DUF3619 domain-containing protein [Betaproteobacteria bacterium HGW-Betaproteobacteria-8]
MKTEHESAKEIINLLDESIGQLDRKVLDRLYAARMKAVGQMAQRKQAATVAGADGISHVLRMFGDYTHQHRVIMPAVMIASAALMVFIVTQQLMPQPAIEQGDAFLLGAELPPEAFLDKGFDAWVARTSQQ